MADDERIELSGVLSRLFSRQLHDHCAYHPLFHVKHAVAVSSDLTRPLGDSSLAKKPICQFSQATIPTRVTYNSCLTLESMSLACDLTGNRTLLYSLRRNRPGQ